MHEQNKANVWKLPPFSRLVKHGLCNWVLQIKQLYTAHIYSDYVCIMLNATTQSFNTLPQNLLKKTILYSGEIAKDSYTFLIFVISDTIS